MSEVFAAKMKAYEANAAETVSLEDKRVAWCAVLEAVKNERNEYDGKYSIPYARALYLYEASYEAENNIDTIDRMIYEKHRAQI